MADEKKEREWGRWWNKVSEEGIKKREGRLDGRRCWRKSRRQGKEAV